MSAPPDPGAVEAVLGGIDGLSERQLQALLAAAVRSYAARAEASEVPLPALPPDCGITATEAMLVVSAILKAVNVQVFELGMWQSWSGR